MQHVALRYLAMKSLQFPTMSEKRVRLLVTQHVQGKPLSSVKEANKAVSMAGLWVVFGFGRCEGCQQGGGCDWLVGFIYFGGFELDCQILSSCDGNMPASVITPQKSLGCPIYHPTRSPSAA
eukprot:scaffold29300_cov19-Tisochrysis_lutea.AAC.1